MSTCPEPESNQRHEDFRPLLYQLSYLGIVRGRIWTSDLVMSPTSFRLLHPAGMYVIDVCSGWGDSNREVTDKITVCPLAAREPIKKYLYKIKPMIGRTDNLLIRISFCN